MIFYWVSKREEVLRKCLFVMKGNKIQAYRGYCPHNSENAGCDTCFLCGHFKRIRVNENLNANIRVCLISPWFCPLRTNIYSLCDLKVADKIIQIFFNFLTFISVCMCVHMQCAHVEVRGQLAGVCSLLLPVGFRNLTQVVSPGDKCL